MIFNQYIVDLPNYTQLNYAVDGHTRGERYFIEGSCPYSPSTTQETSFASRDNLEQIRDHVDIPLAKLIHRGNSDIPDLYSYINSTLETSSETFITSDGECHIVDIYGLVRQSLPSYLKLAVDNNCIDEIVLYQMFRVGAEDGIDTATGGLLDIYSKQPDLIDWDRGKLNKDNRRFTNSETKHPETGEETFSRCAGMRTGRAIEDTLIEVLMDLEENNLIPIYQPGKDITIGKSCKQAIVESVHSKFPNPHDA